MKIDNTTVREVNGYRLIYKPEHRKAMTSENWEGYVYEHVVVAEAALDREISETEVVHHLNGDRKNNRKENLLVLERSQHGKLHAWLSAGAPMCESIRENGENSLKTSFEPPQFCKVCGTTLQLKQESFCSPACSHLTARKVERPTKAQLKKDIDKMSMVKVGKKYGVSDNAIRKWLKSYGLNSQ